MIFSMVKGKLDMVKEVDFKLEKELQNLVETNLDSLLKYDLLSTEFPVENYRFDTIAFNQETNSFVIIEYKRGRNESLIDQGYAYLFTLLNRKADFVLLFNECKKTSKAIPDFDWSQTRIVFISPQFTEYQKRATEFSNIPFQLYEIKRYSNGVVSVEEINQNKGTKLESVPLDKVLDVSFQKVSKEIVVYTEDDVLKRGSESSVELYHSLKQRILEMGDIKLDPKKLYVAFKGKTNICDIVVLKKELKVFLNLKSGQLNDPNRLARTVENVGHWGNGDFQVSISTDESFDYLMTLIRQSFMVNF